MKTLWFWLGIMGVVTSLGVEANVESLKQNIENGEYIKFRVLYRKFLPTVKNPEEWLSLRNLIVNNTDKVGYDLIYITDRRPVRGVRSGVLNLDEARKKADQLMLAGKFDAAFGSYQAIAEQLQRVEQTSKDQREIASAKFFLMYIFHSMARALYGAKRFDESYLVYRWLPITYSRIREVQFEKMWAAFRGGRIDHALGAIASQQSAYFSEYLPPESYLVLSYLNKILCRSKEQEMTLNQINQYKLDLNSGKFGIQEFARQNTETSVLWNLVNQKKKDQSESEKAEIKRILGVLEKAFNNFKKNTITELDKVLAYTRLSVSSESRSILKPIEILPDRQSLFNAGLEIWPADSKEEWIDEFGSHRFVGVSQCKK